MRPNFIYIGPDKSGSTWLYDMLRQHPQVFLAEAKDIYFFDRHYARGYKWYENNFATANGKLAVGEISHDYLFSDDACVRIAADLPGVRLITFLRDPVDRAFSEYLFLRKHGLVDGHFRSATKQFPSILDGGMYGKHLGRYLDVFPRSQILVQRFECLLNDPDVFLRRIFEFLGVHADFRAVGLQEKALPAARPRSSFVARTAKATAELIRLLGMPRLLGRLKRSPLVNRLLYVPYQDSDRPRPADEDRDWLIDYYARDIRELERLLEMDFSGWMCSEISRGAGAQL